MAAKMPGGAPLPSARPPLPLPTKSGAGHCALRAPADNRCLYPRGPSPVVVGPYFGSDYMLADNEKIGGQTETRQSPEGETHPWSTKRGGAPAFAQD